MKIKNYCHVLLLLMATLLMSLFTIPVYAHGGVKFPPSRSIYCQKFADNVNYPEDGSAITDLACKQAIRVDGPGNGYLLTQWHQVSIEIPNYNNFLAVKAAIKDGELCSAGQNFPGLRGLDATSPAWHRTDVKPVNNKLEVTWDAPATHEAGDGIFFQYYLTKPTYDPSLPLMWDDLILIDEFQNPPPSIPGGQPHLFVHHVTIPDGRTGNAILFSRFQRRDPHGEGFYNCSDIKIVDGETPTFPWHEEKQFIPTEIAPHAGQKILFRVLGHTKGDNEVIRQELNITTANDQPSIWGKELAHLVEQHGGSYARIGIKLDNTIAYNEANYRENMVWLADAKDQSFIAVERGDVPGAVKAKITGPASVTAGQTARFDSVATTGGTPPYTYHWTSPEFSEHTSTESATQVTAPHVTHPIVGIVRLLVKDNAGAENIATHNVTINPSSGGNHPPYQVGHSYDAGDIVSNAGGNYRCLVPGWCKGNPVDDAYAPGVGRAWEQAWEQVN